MQLAMIGLGRMGGNMTRRLAHAGHDVVAFDIDAAAAGRLAGEMDAVTAAADLPDLLARLAAPRLLWLMLPQQFVDGTLEALTAAGLAAGDIVVDGGNSNYRESRRRGEGLAAAGVLFVDCGTSGGVWGLQNGYSLMLGGRNEAIARLAPLLTSLAADAGRGWAHVGPAGAGHYVKMVHNGIEYGMMQSIAEGFELIRAKEEFGLDMQQIAQVWRQGSVISSWLLDLTADALDRDPDLSALSDWMDDSGEGRWAASESVDLGVPAPVLTLALQMRFRSRQQPAFAGKVVNAMRGGFGGHAIRPAAKDEEQQP